MARGEISSDLTTAIAESGRLRSSVEGYASLPFGALCNATEGIPGSGTHDGAAARVQASLGSWVQLINSDADAIINTGLSFSEADGGAAARLLGIGD